MLSLMLRRQTLMGAGKPHALSNPPLVIAYAGHRLSPGNPIVADDTRNVTQYYALSGGDTINYLIKDTTIADGASLGFLCVYRASYNYHDYYNETNNIQKTIRMGNTIMYFRLTMTTNCEADSYAYNQTTGAVYFAGRNTPYYGKTNIND